MDTYKKDIGELVRKMENDYTSGTTKLSKYVDYSMYETIEKIEAYAHSKHTSGDTDSMGREKPFFNIGTGAENIWYRATDIDRRNIRIKASKESDVLKSYLGTAKLQDWMKRENFGSFLNQWGRSLARYGSTVLKFVEVEGKLHPMVMSWQKMIVDPIDFDANPKIEKIELTPAQLRKRKGYDKEMVKSLLDAVATRTTLERQQKDNKSGYITLYEVHGELPLSYITGKEEDGDEFVQQMHVVSFVASGKKDSEGNAEYNDFCLFKGRESKDPYMITHLIKEDGQTLAVGAIQSLFEAQWMQNHSVKAVKDHLDLASKLIFQTSDGNFVGQNALAAIENGDILVHAINQPLTQINNSSHDVSAFQSFQNQWKVLAQEITSTPDAISGNNFPSGTAYRQVALLNQEAHSLFEIMTENKGIHIEEMMRLFVLPFIKRTELNTKDEILATLDQYGIKEIDANYIKVEVEKQAKRGIIDALVAGKVPSVDIASMKEDVAAQMRELGGKRSFKPSEIESKTWAEYFKDFEWDVEVEVTNENTDKEVVLTTLSTVLQTIATNPLVLQDPNARLLFNKILEEAGRVSPVELAQVEQTPQLPVPQLKT